MSRREMSGLRASSQGTRDNSAYPQIMPSTNHASCVNWREKEGKHLAGLECGAGGEERVPIYLLCHDKESSLY